MIGKLFQEKSLVSHHLESFNSFITHGIQDIFDKEPDVLLSLDHSISIDKAEALYPTLLPSEARTNNLNYESVVLATVTETCKGEIKSTQRVQIGAIPMMVKSNRCRLYDVPKPNLPSYGECEYDLGGYFILKGVERVLVSQVRGSYNIPVVFKNQNPLKYTYVCKVRSMSEVTGHSSLTEMSITQTGVIYVQFGLFKSGGVVEYASLLEFLLSGETDNDILPLFK